MIFYLPFLAWVHFSAGAALGGMAALSLKALLDMLRQDRATRS